MRCPPLIRAAAGCRCITTTVKSIAAASGVNASVRFGPVAYPVTTNPAQLTQASLPALNLAVVARSLAALAVDFLQRK